MKPFNAVCFCVLMDHHRRGIEEAHPNYISEKLEMFNRMDEIGALSLLDAPNQSRVREWCANWKVAMPEYD